MVTVLKVPSGFSVEAINFAVVYDAARPNEFFVRSATLQQSFLIPCSCDDVGMFDTLGDLSEPTCTSDDHAVELTFIGTSSRWRKKYHVIVSNNCIEFYYELFGFGRIATLRYFEGALAQSSDLQRSNLRHFHDHAAPAYREWSVASPISFKVVLNPEPNNYAKHLFAPADYSQISANSDLDYCGGNFIFNPGLLSYAISSEPSSEWLTLGIGAEPGHYSFSEFEYIGGTEFGLNLNYWGATTVSGYLKAPSIFMCFGKTYETALQGYVDILREKAWVPPLRQDVGRPDWWDGPIICGWGHQCYMGDLFRVRSPLDRGVDAAAYLMCTQANYQEFVRILDGHGLPWRILIIDSRWTIASGPKRLDQGRWPSLRDWVDELHERGKKVILWWGLWETEGLDSNQCITYSATGTGASLNRPGRTAKFGGLYEGKKLAPDPTLPIVREQLRSSLRQILSSDAGALNIDGLKIDHAAGVPGLYGLVFPPNSERLYGIELMKWYQTFLYTEAKAIKPEALIVSFQRLFYNIFQGKVQF